MDRPSMVDAHVHLWNLETQNHEWLSDEWSESQAAYLGDYTPIRRNYLIEDLLADFEGNDVVKAVHVQADWGGNQVDETRWLQSIADEHGYPQASSPGPTCGSPAPSRRLEDHLRSPNVRGIRSSPTSPACS